MADSVASFPYETRLNILHPPLEVIDEKAIADACEYKWFNQTLCQVNGSVVRIGVIEGEYHWHKHDDDDEFFYGPASHPRPATHSDPDGGERRDHSDRQLKPGYREQVAGCRAQVAGRSWWCETQAPATESE